MPGMELAIIRFLCLVALTVCFGVGVAFGRWLREGEIRDAHIDGKNILICDRKYKITKF